MRYIIRLVSITVGVLMGVPWATLVFFVSVSRFGMQAIWMALKDQNPALEFQRGGYVIPPSFAHSRTSNADPHLYSVIYPVTIPKPAPSGAQPKENDR